MARSCPRPAKPPTASPTGRSAATLPSRLRRTLAHVGAAAPDWSRSDVELPPGVYRSACELRDDLALIADDFGRRSTGHVTEGLVRDLMRQVEVFGLQCCRSTCGNTARGTAAALDEIFRWAGVCRSLSETDAERAVRAARPRTDAAASAVAGPSAVYPETREIVQTFRTIAAILEQQCAEAIETYMISGATRAGPLAGSVAAGARGAAVSPRRGHQPAEYRAAARITRAACSRPCRSSNGC